METPNPPVPRTRPTDCQIPSTFISHTSSLLNLAILLLVPPSFPLRFFPSRSPCGGLPYFYSGLIYHCLPVALALRYGRPTDVQSETSPTLSISLFFLPDQSLSCSSLDVCCCPRFASEGLVNILTRRYLSRETRRRVFHFCWYLEFYWQKRHCVVSAFLSPPLTYL